jgi:hypothetical protein
MDRVWATTVREKRLSSYSTTLLIRACLGCAPMRSLVSRTGLEGLAHEARQGRKGLWADTRPPATVGKKEIAESPVWLRNTTISPIRPSRLVSLRRHAHRLTPSPNRAVVLIPPGEVNDELCPNEKMVDVSRLSNVHSFVGMDKSFQS